MPLDDRITKRILKWLEIADEDLRVAEFTFKMESNVPYRMIAFHAQQAAEKYLKALLVYYRIDFPYTHDILKLIELIPQNPELKSKLDPVIKLTDYAVNRRYPDFYESLSLEEAHESVKLAKITAEYVKELLNREGFFKKK